MRSFLLAFLVASAASVPTQREFWPRLPEAKPGQWRYRHPERAQTFDEYRAADPTRGTSERKVIYIWPALTRPMREPDRIEKLAELLHAYFGREVRVLKPAALPRRAYDPKRRRLSIRHCIPALVKRLPEDGLFLLAITDRDMHLPGTRYTFGWGSLKLRVGVLSTSRLAAGADEVTRVSLRYRIIPRATYQRSRKLNQQHPTTYLAYITGPSRTADIERVLTIGVHGPKELHILLCDTCGDDPLSM